MTKQLQMARHYHKHICKIFSSSRDVANFLDETWTEKEDIKLHLKMVKRLCRLIENYEYYFTNESEPENLLKARLNKYNFSNSFKKVSFTSNLVPTNMIMPIKKRRVSRI